MYNLSFSCLRIKIEDDATEPEYITTVWGYGYKWGY